MGLYRLYIVWYSIAIYSVDKKVYPDIGTLTKYYKNTHHLLQARYIIPKIEQELVTTSELWILFVLPRANPVFIITSHTEVIHVVSLLFRELSLSLRVL